MSLNVLLVQYVQGSTFLFWRIFPCILDQPRSEYSDRQLSIYFGPVTIPLMEKVWEPSKLVYDKSPKLSSNLKWNSKFEKFVYYKRFPTAGKKTFFPSMHGSNTQNFPCILPQSRGSYTQFDNSSYILAQSRFIFSQNIY